MAEISEKVTEVDRYMSANAQTSSKALEEVLFRDEAYVY